MKEVGEFGWEFKDIFCELEWVEVIEDVCEWIGMIWLSGCEEWLKLWFFVMFN